MDIELDHRNVVTVGGWLLFPAVKYGVNTEIKTPHGTKKSGWLSTETLGVVYIAFDMTGEEREITQEVRDMVDGHVLTQEKFSNLISLMVKTIEQGLRKE